MIHNIYIIVKSGGNLEMLSKQMDQHIKKMIGETSSSQIELPKVEKEYAEKHSMVEADINIIEKDENSRFVDAYIERSNKESEELIGVESVDFLEQSIDYLKQNIHEFVYMESQWFELIGVDAICLEVDDLFGTYEALLGLRLQKKYNQAIRDYLQAELKGDAAKFALLFNSEDGLWDLNISLNDIDGFQENLSIGDAYQLVYHFLFKLAETVEEGQ